MKSKYLNLNTLNVESEVDLTMRQSAYIIPAPPIISSTNKSASKQQ
jgi:hypothetical protein